MSNLKCPACGYEESQVIDVRLNQAGVRRRRKCNHCKERFTTLETIVVSIPQEIQKKMEGLQLLLTEKQILEEKVNGVRREIASLEAEQRRETAKKEPPRKPGRPPKTPVLNGHKPPTQPSTRRQLDMALHRARIAAITIEDEELLNDPDLMDSDSDIDLSEFDNDEFD